MKKNKKILILIVITLLLTGCVKYNVEMNVKKDKSMDFSVIYAIDSSLTKDIPALLSDSDKQKLEKRGFKVSDYEKDGMKGFSLVKSIKNIDDVSSKKSAEYSISNIVDEKQNSIFTVKKRLFKNKYIAKFKFDSNDSSLNDSSSTDDSDDLLTDDSDDLLTDGSDDLLTDDSDDYLSMFKNMDMSFTVKLPYSAKSNNATKTANDNKDLTWNLSSELSDGIHFEFELYNMMVIYIACGVGFLIVLVLIIIIISKINKNKKSSATSIESNNNENVVSVDNINETDSDSVDSKEII